MHKKYRWQDDKLHSLTWMRVNETGKSIVLFTNSLFNYIQTALFDTDRAI